MNKILKDYITRLEFEGKTKDTIATYSITIEKFLDYIDDITKVTPTTVRNFISYMEQNSRTGKYSNSTKNTHIRVLKTFGTFLESEGIIEENIFSKIKLMKTEKKEPVYFSDEQIQSILENNKKIRDNIMIRLLFCSGVRRNELINIKISDILKDENKDIYVLRVVYGKGNKIRKVVLPENLVNDIYDYYKSKGNNNEYLFATRTGKRIQREYIDVMFRRWLKNANINTKIDDKTKLVLHSTRKNYASTLDRQGVSLLSIQYALGHSNSRTTALYVKGNYNSYSEQMEKVNFAY